jgi:hypothetical protein
MDTKNNVDLINLDTKHGVNLRLAGENSGWGAFGARKGTVVENQAGFGGVNSINKVKFKTEDGVYLVAMDRQGTGIDNSYKNLCSGPNGNWVYLMNFDTTERNKPECKWKYDKENRTISSEKWPEYCLGPWGASGKFSLRKCGDGDIVRWIWEDDWNTCQSLGLSLQECKLSKINDTKNQCKKYTDNEICNINNINNIKTECSNLGISDIECKKSLLDNIKSYFSNDLKDKNYTLYKNCINKNISSQDCSQTLIDKCDSYKFNSPGNVKSCNLKTVDAHESSCKDVGLDLTICTVDELTKALDRQVISEGQQISTNIALQAIEENKKQGEQFLNQVTAILNGGATSSGSSNIIEDAKNLDNNTALLIGVGLLATYLILSE